MLREFSTGAGVWFDFWSTPCLHDFWSTPCLVLRYLFFIEPLCGVIFQANSACDSVGPSFGKGEPNWAWGLRSRLTLAWNNQSDKPRESSAIYAMSWMLLYRYLRSLLHFCIPTFPVELPFFVAINHQLPKPLTTEFRYATCPRTVEGIEDWQCRTNISCCVRGQHVQYLWLRKICWSKYMLGCIRSLLWDSSLHYHCAACYSNFHPIEAVSWWLSSTIRLGMPRRGHLSHILVFPHDLSQQCHQIRSILFANFQWGDTAEWLAENHLFLSRHHMDHDVCGQALFSGFLQKTYRASVQANQHILLDYSCVHCCFLDVHCWGTIHFVSLFRYQNLWASLFLLQVSR